MKEIIEKIQERLADYGDLRYVDENWGQLDYYSPNFPVKWPCALIDVVDARFSNIGRDRNQVPEQRQMGRIVVELRVANLRLSNSSAKAPRLQKEYARGIWDIIQGIHERLHGWAPNEMTSRLIRESVNRVRRDDGVQEYAVRFSCEANNC